MTKREKMRAQKLAQKVVKEEPKLNPNYKPGRRSLSEMFNGVNRSKFVKTDF